MTPRPSLLPPQPTPHSRGDTNSAVFGAVARRLCIVIASRVADVLWQGPRAVVSRNWIHYQVVHGALARVLNEASR